MDRQTFFEFCAFATSIFEQMNQNQKKIIFLGR